MQVILYTKENCPLCEEAKHLLLTIRENISFDLKEQDIYQDDNLLEKYQLMIPVVQVNGRDVDYGQTDLGKVSDALKQEENM